MVVGGPQNRNDATAMELEQRINEYLFYEFGLDGEEDARRIARDWPFALRPVATADGQDLFAFEDDEPYFVVTQPSLRFFPAAGMSADDIILQQQGSRWLAAREPVDLATSRIGAPGVPSLPARRAALQALAAEHGQLLEGLFLVDSRQYLCLTATESGDTVVLGLKGSPIVVGFPACSAWRRLAWGVGQWLRVRE